MSPPVILSNTEVLMQIKDKSRALYIRTFNMLREFVGDQLETRSPSEEDIMRFIKHLREEKEMASSTLWTMYNMINGICRGKYHIENFNCQNILNICIICNLLLNSIKRLLLLFHFIIARGEMGIVKHAVHSRRFILHIEIKDSLKETTNSS